MARENLRAGTSPSSSNDFDNSIARSDPGKVNAPSPLSSNVIEQEMPKWTSRKAARVSDFVINSFGILGFLKSRLPEGLQKRINSKPIENPASLRMKSRRVPTAKDCRSHLDDRFLSGFFDIWPTRAAVHVVLGK
jgi:hypothetical protein